ncbi:MAG TPA: TenA family protein [Thermopolyspora sp.]
MTHSYAQWQAARQADSEVRFSEWLRSAAEPEWTAVIDHPFAAAINRGDAPRDRMRRYLTQDFQFVDSFTALLGAAVACADTFEARVPFGRFLGETVSDTERGYFHRALAALGADPADRPRLERVTEEFRALMNEARDSQDYPLILAVLCVAEWSYLGWASQAVPPLPGDFLYREWIELHSGLDFEAWVAFLRGELDRLGPTLAEPHQYRVRDAFRRATHLERGFFDMAAASSGDPDRR